MSATILAALKEKYTQHIHEQRQEALPYSVLSPEIRLVDVPRILLTQGVRPALEIPGLGNVQGRLDSQQMLIYERRKMNMANLFTPFSAKETTPRVVYIVGGGGVGKTTLSWQAAVDSTDGGRAPLWPQFVWKIHVTLRDVAMTQRDLCESTQTTAADLLYNCVFKKVPGVSSVDELQSIMSQWTPDNCLLILDGWDEVDVKGCHRGLKSLVDLENATRLVTAQPRHGLHLDNADRVVEVFGFTPELANQYVQGGHTAGANELLELIKQSPFLSAQSRVPLVLRTICQIYGRDPRALDGISTLTELFNATRPSDNAEKDTVGDQLSEAAWSMCVRRDGGQTIERWLYKEQYDTLLKDGPSVSAVVVPSGEEDVSAGGRCYHFVHYTFQEYYCGRRIATAVLAGETDPTCRDALALIRQYKGDERFALIFQFAVGTLASRRGGNDALRLVFELFAEGEHQIGRITYLSTLLDAAKCSHVMDDGAPFRVVVEWLKGVCSAGTLDVNDLLLGTTGVAVVVAALKSSETINTVNASDCELGDEGIAALGGVLRVSKSLTKLSVGNNHITSRGASALSIILRVNDTLRVLDLTGNNEIGGTGTQSLAASIQANSALRELNLSDCGIGDGDISALVSMLRANTTLTRLNVGNNELTSRGATPLLGNFKIQTLDLSSNRDIGVIGAFNLSSALQSNTNLTALELFGCDIGNGGVGAIASMLHVNSTIKRLNFGGNGVSGSGVSHLADVVAKNGTLKALDLSRNINLGPEGAKVLSTALKTNTGITDLDLSICSLGDHGFIEVADMLRTNTTIAKLNLSSNSVTAFGVSALVEALCENSTVTSLDVSRNRNLGGECARGFAVFLIVNISIRELNVVRCGFDDDGIVAFATALRKNKALKTLNMQFNAITAAGAQHLLTMLQEHNTTLEVVDLKDNPAYNDTVYRQIQELLSQRRNQQLEQPQQ